MCLDTITAKNRNLSGTGWKVFREIGDGYSTPCYGMGIYASNKWVNKEENTLIGHLWYLSGFHIFKKKNDAKWFLNWLAIEYGYLIRKVLYRKAHTYGTQSVDGTITKVIVANEMKILN